MPNFVTKYRLTNFGASLRKVLIVFHTAFGVGVPGNHEGKRFQPRIGQRRAEAIEGDACVRLQLGGIIGKVHIEVDREPLLGLASARRNAALHTARQRLFPALGI